MSDTELKDSVIIPPRTVFFYNNLGEIQPKKTFTVSRERVNHRGITEFYINEFKRFVEYNPDTMTTLEIVLPN